MNPQLIFALILLISGPLFLTIGILIKKTKN